VNLELLTIAVGADLVVVAPPRRPPLPVAVTLLLTVVTQPASAPGGASVATTP
jgi:hypothetical protein